MQRRGGKNAGGLRRTCAVKRANCVWETAKRGCGPPACRFGLGGRTLGGHARRQKSGAPAGDVARRAGSAAGIRKSKADGRTVRFAGRGLL